MATITVLVASNLTSKLLYHSHQHSESGEMKSNSLGSNPFPKARMLETVLTLSLHSEGTTGSWAARSVLHTTGGVNKAKIRKNVMTFPTVLGVDFSWLGFQLLDACS